MSKSHRFVYEAIIRLDVTAEDEGLTLHGSELEYDHNLPVDQWQEDGRFTEAGVNAMLFGFSSGVIGVIHAAGQQTGADTAKLLRQAIDIMEQQFVAQVKAVDSLHTSQLSIRQ